MNAIQKGISRLRRKTVAFSWLDGTGENCREGLEQADRNCRRTLLLIAAAVPVLLLLGWFASGTGSDALTRNPYGAGKKQVTATAAFTAAGEQYVQEMELDIQEAGLCCADADVLFDSCRQWLSETCFSGTCAGEDLILPQQSEDGRVSIFWTSSDPSRISSEGEVNLLDLPAGCSVILTAEMSADVYTETADFCISLSNEQRNLQASLKRLAEHTAEELSENTEGEALQLPSQIGETEVVWTFPGHRILWELIPLGGFLALFVSLSRYEKLTAHLKTQKEAVERDIPSMTLQLILMLNAGLVADTAFREIISRNDRPGAQPLYRAMASVRRNAEEQNLPFAGELYIFARQTGIRSFIRVATLVRDHVSHGSELAGKLEKERELLWSGRLSAAKAKAKQADTKLCFPLVLLLLSLIILSCAPAFMTM